MINDIIQYINRHDIIIIIYRLYFVHRLRVDHQTIRTNENQIFV